MSYTPLIFIDIKEYDEVKTLMDEYDIKVYIYKLSTFPICFIGRSEFSSESFVIRKLLDKAEIKYEEVN